MGQLREEKIQLAIDLLSPKQYTINKQTFIYNIMNNK